ncbi:MAG TPA: RNA polymerase sigma factor [Longimicrobiales bacterium]|nr:RNA polymerase sigma factor [Longimicrobiales bacterium]
MATMGPPTTDAEDVALATAGDTRAFERLYRRHVARIHALCRRMVGPSLADDTAQDVFIRAWEKLELFEGKSAFGTWLYRLAINVCLARRTKAGKRQERFRSDAVALERAVAPPRRHADHRMDLDRAIERLPERARQVFVLHDVEGYKHREIGDLLGISSGTSKSQLHEARMALRAQLRA